MLFSSSFFFRLFLYDLVFLVGLARELSSGGSRRMGPARWCGATAETAGTRASLQGERGSRQVGGRGGMKND